MCRRRARFATVVKETLDESKDILQERISERNVNQADDVPVSPVMKEIFDEIKDILQQHIFEHIVNQADDVTVSPQ